jgi:hypothetical protein
MSSRHKEFAININVRAYRCITNPSRRLSTYVYLKSPNVLKYMTDELRSYLVHRHEHYTHKSVRDDHRLVDYIPKLIIEILLDAHRGLSYASSLMHYEVSSVDDNPIECCICYQDIITAHLVTGCNKEPLHISCKNKLMNNRYPMCRAYTNMMDDEDRWFIELEDLLMPSMREIEGITQMLIPGT